MRRLQVLGFSLIELLVAVAIVAILGAIAYPSYIGYVAKSNRGEAQRELVRLANLEEQFYVDTRAYTSDMTKLGMGADPYDSGNYTIDAAVVNDTFTLTAIAKEPQASNDDSACKKLYITDTGKKTPSSCWEQ